MPNWNRPRPRAPVAVPPAVVLALALGLAAPVAADVHSLDADVSLGELLEGLRQRFPQFGDLMAADRLHPAVAANLNGDRFVSDPATPLTRGDRLLILSADVGG